MAVYITERVGRFMSQNPEKITNNMDGVLLYVLRQKAKKWALKVVLCAAVETSVFEAIYLPIIKKHLRHHITEMCYKI